MEILPALLALEHQGDKNGTPILRAGSLQVSKAVLNLFKCLSQQMAMSERPRACIQNASHLKARVTTVHPATQQLDTKLHLLKDLHMIMNPASAALTLPKLANSDACYALSFLEDEAAPGAFT